MWEYDWSKCIFISNYYTKFSLYQLDRVECYSEHYLENSRADRIQHFALL